MNLDLHLADEFPRISSRVRYEEEKEVFYFLSENPQGDEIELFTDIYLAWKIRKGSYSSQAETPDEYYDTWSLVAWEEGKVWLDGETEVKPEEVLDSEEFKRYSQQLQEFVAKFE